MTTASPAPDPSQIELCSRWAKDALGDAAAAECVAHIAARLAAGSVSLSVEACALLHGMLQKRLPL